MDVAQHTTSFYRHRVVHKHRQANSVSIKLVNTCADAAPLCSAASGFLLLVKTLLRHKYYDHVELFCAHTDTRPAADPLIS